MKEITDIKVLADIFYNRTQEDMELNGVYDETDPYTQLVGTICEMLFNQLDVRTANALEKKLFELVYLNEKNNYCAGFRTGVEIAGVAVFEQGTILIGGSSPNPIDGKSSISITIIICLHFISI